MRKDHRQLKRKVLEFMRDWYEKNVSVLREWHGMDIQSLREGMEEAKSNSEKAKTEVDMTAMAADVNEVTK